ncbi:MAG: ArsR family transcriptional regulator [Chloroflexi bacterium]|nr:ArsR family transcriptional regulator [Chloroflexota bacterium]
MGSTREQILQLIQRRRSDTVAGLARALGLAPATVRRHMDILQRDGLVTYTEARRGAGRPEHCFSLTERGHASRPKGYDALLSNLIVELGKMPAAEVSGLDGSRILADTITKLGKRVAGQYRESNGRAPVHAAVQALRDRNFDPEISTTAEGLRITLANCPFRSVALTTQAVCGYDAAILSTILRSPVSLERCITGGAECCVYVVPNRARAANGAGRAKHQKARQSQRRQL